MRSPTPLRPPKVSGLAPLATPSWVISDRPRVMSAASALRSKPIPLARPTAIATTFFAQPPISTPMTSSVRYGRKNGVWNASWTTRAYRRFLAAIVTAVGRPAATSTANDGPDR